MDNLAVEIRIADLDGFKEVVQSAAALVEQIEASNCRDKFQQPLFNLKSAVSNLTVKK